MSKFRIIPLLAALFIFASSVSAKKARDPSQRVVTYDARSMIINGTRELLFSGSIHYPRSTPDMWPGLIRRAKEGGLNVISTYVFWNIHEPLPGKFNFGGNYDFLKFIRLIGDSGLWVTLRIGPYIEAEWNMGGFPYWLKEVPNITFRSFNEPFLFHMKKYAENIINMVKRERLFADQGGPIILAQIENEYNNVQLSYRESGTKYIRWAADMAVELHKGVPWIMCKQKNAPPNVISTCNGRHCGDTFTRSPGKPFLWTENWTAQYRVFGDSPSQRAAEDLSFAVARFFARNGSFNNYYMYYGGTNFGRTSSSFVTTRYYDEAPLDEYGLKRDPKFSHLRDLHKTLRMVKKPLLWGVQSIQKVSQNLEITMYEIPGRNVCAAFLTNNNTKIDSSINFRGVNYFLPAKSISILPDCKTVVYNTNTVVTQHSSRNFVPARESMITKWEMFKEAIPTIDNLEIKSKTPRELYSLNKDQSDYAWYSTRIDFDQRDLPMRSDILPVLMIASLGHALVAFVNGEYVGFGHGSNVEKSHVFKKSVVLRPGVNDITMLAMTVGLPNSGAYMEKRFAGPRAVTLEGLMAGTLDITHNQWGQQIGVFGERTQIYTEEGSKKVQWVPYNRVRGPVTWYKGLFDAPRGNAPVAIRMMSMEKGMVWINGQSIGRYWISYLSPLGKPTQEEYHIPRAFLKPKGNLIVVFEETGGDPEKIEIQTVNRDTICSIISDFHQTPIKAFERNNIQFHSIGNPVKAGYLNCPEGKVIKKIEFASFGDAVGACGAFTYGKCHSPKVQKIVEQLCLGRPMCTIPFEKETLLENGKDPCPEIAKTLSVQVRCGRSKTGTI